MTIFNEKRDRINNVVTEVKPSLYEIVKKQL